jgi:uncharacterized protein
MRNARRLGLTFFLIALALTVSLRTDGVGAQQKTTAGAFVWYDLVTTDVAAAKSFYAELLGWHLNDTTRNNKPYVIAQAGGRPIGGIIGIESAPNVGSQWVSYLIVEDLERSVSEAQSAGGRVLVPVTRAPRGHVAVVADAQGAPVGIARVTLPAQGVADARMGQFFWTDYIATDGASALNFYRRVAGYSVDSTAPLARGTHLILDKGGPRAGMFLLPADTTNIRSHWLPHVRVADPAALAAKAVQLGGQVLLAPRPDVRRNTLAIVADPTGGAIALQKWPIEEP